MNSLNQSIGSWPGRRARSDGDRTALIFEDRTFTYHDLHRRACALAAAWRTAGVQVGARIAYLGPNHPALLESLFAAGLLGAVFVPLNHRLAAGELNDQLASATPDVLVLGQQARGRAAELETEAEVVFEEELDALRKRSDPAAFTAAKVSLDDPCLVLYTSGSTGRPRGVVLTHGNITWNAINVLVDGDLRDGDSGLVTGPLFHTAALNVDTLPAFLKGGTIVLTSRFDPDEVLKLIAKHAIAYTGGVPTMYEMLVRSPLWAGTDLSSLRYVQCGGAPVSEQLLSAFHDRGIRVIQGYGLTEAAPGVLLLRSHDAARKSGSAGTPHFFTDVRTDGWAGEPGEIQVSGPNVTPGYWNTDATPAFAADGWLRTGDLARFDDEGFGWITGRKKDMIISGGENVWPAEVEAAFRAHPAVADCAVFGVPDPLWGEVPLAVVVVAPGREVPLSDLAGFVRSRLAGYKTPKVIEYAVALPRTGSGKVDKPELRRRLGF